MHTDPVVKEILVNAPAHKVWKALTDPEDMKSWYFPVETFIPEPGFTFTFYGEKDDRQFPISCMILEARPGKKLSYTWNYDDFPGETIVTFTIDEEYGQTRVRLTHEGLENISEEHKDASKENHALGWESIIGSSLKEYLENR